MILLFVAAAIFSLHSLQLLLYTPIFLYRRAVKHVGIQAARIQVNRCKFHIRMTRDVKLCTEIRTHILQRCWTHFYQAQVSTRECAYVYVFLENFNFNKCTVCLKISVQNERSNICGKKGKCFADSQEKIRNRPKKMLEFEMRNNYSNWAKWEFQE